MISGTLGVIGCPVLEDELVHSLAKDPDEKNVYVVDTKAAHTLKGRLERNHIPFKTIDEWDFENGYDCVDRKNGFNVVIYMNRLGLHADPKILKKTIEDEIMLFQSRFDVIALYYGMCGNGGWDPTAWAKDAADVPVLVFRDSEGRVCDDCIGVAVGGPKPYFELLRKYTGMLFITPALAADWDEYADELDFLKGFEVLDIHTLPEVFKIYGYNNSVKIDTGLGVRDGLDDRYRHVEDATGLKMVTAENVADIRPADMLYEQAKEILSKGKHF